MTAPVKTHMAISSVPALKDASAPGRNEHAGKYLTFSLRPEEFAIEVLKVREIIGIPDITAVPQTPKFLRGVINLRGKVIPVVDLRLKFGMPEQPYTPQTCIIVIQLEHHPPTLMGIVVDEVLEVLHFAAVDIEDAPGLGGGSSPSGVLGLTRNKGKVKILLDINQVLTTEMR